MNDLVTGISGSLPYLVRTEKCQLLSNTKLAGDLKALISSHMYVLEIQISALLLWQGAVIKYSFFFQRFTD